jgi:multidrug resistance efflux pump
MAQPAPDQDKKADNPASDAEPARSAPPEETTPTAPQKQASDPVKKGSIALLLVIALTMAWYLLADRYTPYTSQARIQAYVVPVAPEVAGTVSNVHVKNNQIVKPGDILFEIDRTQYEIAADQAAAELETVRRQVGAATAAVDSAQASLRAAKANEVKATQDIDRLERLYEEDPGTISVRRLEIARATKEQATSQVAAAVADVRRAIEEQGGDTADNAKLRSARSKLEKAKLDLKKTTVKALTSGLVTDLHVDIGQFAGTGSPVMTLITINDLWINAEFTENNLGHLKPGSPVEIVLDAVPGKVIKGKVRSIGFGVSTGQATPPGSLPTIENNRDWLRQAQRFPVVVEFNVAEYPQLLKSIRLGGQAEVIAYTEGHGALNALGRAFIRMMSWLSYAY